MFAVSGLQLLWLSACQGNADSIPEDGNPLGFALHIPEGFAAWPGCYNNLFHLGFMSSTVEQRIIECAIPGDRTQPFQAECRGCAQLRHMPEAFAAPGEPYDIQAEIEVLFERPIDWLEDATCLTIQKFIWEFQIR